MVTQAARLSRTSGSAAVASVFHPNCDKGLEGGPGAEAVQSRDLKIFSAWHN